MSAPAILATLTGPARRGSGTDRFAPSDHGCWGYTSDAERAQAATEWLVDGLRQGQRGIYVGRDPVPDLTAELAEVPNRDALLREGSLQVFTLTDLYDLAGPIDADAQLAVYDAAVRQAVDDGYQGVRAAADITGLVADRTRRPAHVHWEQVADRYIVEHPLAPLCLYDARGATDISGVIGCHPLQGPEESTFASYATGPDGCALAGELDLAGHRALEIVLAALPRSDRVVDVSRLSFLDGRAAHLVHQELLARRREGQLIALSGASRAFHAIWRICGFDSSFLN